MGLLARLAGGQSEMAQANEAVAEYKRRTGSVSRQQAETGGSGAGYSRTKVGDRKLTHAEQKRLAAMEERVANQTYGHSNNHGMRNITRG